MTDKSNSVITTDQEDEESYLLRVETLTVRVSRQKLQSLQHVDPDDYHKELWGILKDQGEIVSRQIHLTVK